MRGVRFALVLVTVTLSGCLAGAQYALSGKGKCEIESPPWMYRRETFSDGEWLGSESLLLDEGRIVLLQFGPAARLREGAQEERQRLHNITLEQVASALEELGRAGSKVWRADGGALNATDLAQAQELVSATVDLPECKHVAEDCYDGGGSAFELRGESRSRRIVGGRCGDAPEIESLSLWMEERFRTIRRVAPFY